VHTAEYHTNVICMTNIPRQLFNQILLFKATENAMQCKKGTLYLVNLIAIAIFDFYYRLYSSYVKYHGTFWK